ncbi:MAG: LacI family DNA-binding transcriptional regulator [Phycisphaeraceae bacterium]
MSIVEVAKLAGVSHATVSRVINNRPGVSPECVQLVRRAMQQIGYSPSARGRGASTPVKVGTVALLMIGADLTLMMAPVAGSVLHAVEDALAARGFNLILGKLNDSGRLPPNVANGRVDGLLLYGFPPQRKHQLRLAKFPCVWLLSARHSRGYWGDRIEPDNEAIGRIAAEYLISRGHTRLALLNLKPDHMGYPVRSQAFVEAARERGCEAHLLVEGEIDRSSPFVAEFDEESVADLVDHYLALKDRPTGLFVPRDSLTVMVYHALRARGVEPGRDVEVISCNNEPVLAGLDPRPATIDLRPEIIGRQAVDQLIRRIHASHDPVSVVSAVEPKLIPGDACAVRT